MSIVSSVSWANQATPCRFQKPAESRLLMGAIRPFHAALLSLAVLLSGCSDQPSESDAQSYIVNALTNDFAQWQNQQFQVSDFQKSDGQSVTQDGVQYYQMSVQYNIELPNGFNPGRLGYYGFGDCGQPLQGTLPPNTAVQCKTVVTFEKSENGWQAIKSEAQS